MKVFVFTEDGALARCNTDEREVRESCHRMLDGEREDALVLAVYVVYSLWPDWEVKLRRRFMTSKKFEVGGRKAPWQCVRMFGTPDGLPRGDFKLGRVKIAVGTSIGGESLSYPLRYCSNDGWRYHVPTLPSHIALLLAQETVQPSELERVDHRNASVLERVRQAGFELRADCVRYGDMPCNQ